MAYGANVIVNTPPAAHWIVNVPAVEVKSEPKFTPTRRSFPAKASA